MIKVFMTILLWCMRCDKKVNYFIDVERGYMEENLTKIVSAIRYKKSIDVFKCMKYIPYAVVKGEALSIQAYGKVGQRQGGDIDILIWLRTMKYKNLLLSLFMI